MKFHIKLIPRPLCCTCDKMKELGSYKFPDALLLGIRFDLDYTFGTQDQGIGLLLCKINY